MQEQTAAMTEKELTDSELGKKSAYEQTYNPDLLYPIPREGKRREIGVDPIHLPFHGYDCWNHYEVSWLNPKGKPIVATAEIVYDCRSPLIIESKSLKLYFNSFNQTKYASIDDVADVIRRDLGERLGVDVDINLHKVGTIDSPITRSLAGVSIDDLDIECDTYSVDPTFLKTSDKEVTDETLFSDLLKSNCLVTNQPDWGSVQIRYSGKQIDREGLLRYIVSFRKHNEFHEQCIERIFVDIMNRCKPSHLTVIGRYTRRGGIDINPVRTTDEHYPRDNTRLIRQ